MLCLSCTEAATTSAAEEEEAYSSEDEATATPLSSTAALTALSGAISEADFPRAAGADARAPQKPLARGSSSVADEEQAVSEAAASSGALDAAGDAKKKRNRKQRYKDNLVRASRPPASCLHLRHTARTCLLESRRHAATPHGSCSWTPEQPGMCCFHRAGTCAQLQRYE